MPMLVALRGIFIDVRFSARGFLRRPGLLLALLFTIALGIGSNASVRGFVRASTTPASPLAFGDGVASVFRQDSRRTARPLSYQDYLSLQSRVDLFEWIGAARVSPRTVTLAGPRLVPPIRSAVAFRVSVNLRGTRAAECSLRPTRVPPSRYFNVAPLASVDNACCRDCN